MNVRAKWWVVAVAAALAGCNQGAIDTGGSAGEADAPTELVAKARSPIPDVPAPLGFKMDQKHSLSAAAPGVRLITYRYKGSADKWAVGRFYKRQMPSYQWVHEADRMIHGTIFLNFRKEGELCTIVIRDRTWGGSEVDVEVFPARRTGSE